VTRVLVERKRCRDPFVRSTQRALRAKGSRHLFRSTLTPRTRNSALKGISPMWSEWALSHWPVLFICVGKIAAAVMDWWKFKVPNKLTFPLILSGWLLGLLNNFELVPFGGEGGLGSALAGTLLACGLLLPMYAIGGMGAGDVKMTMGFGSWIGAF